jgi:hypothetical protein
MAPPGKPHGRRRPPLLQQHPPGNVEHGAPGARHDDGIMADLPAQGFDIADLLAPHGLRP